MEPKPTLPFHPYLLLALLFPFLQAQAQKERPRVGIKAGAVISNLSVRAVDPIIETDKKISATVGVFVHIPVKGRFYIRPAVEYISKGAFTDHNVYTYDKKIQFSYLEIPVNLLHEFPHKKNKWFAGGGPVASFLLNKVVNRGIATYDVGVNVLAGYEWEIGVSLAVNFTQGLKNLVEDNNGGNIKNHFFGLTMGYWF